MSPYSCVPDHVRNTNISLATNWRSGPITCRPRAIYRDTVAAWCEPVSEVITNSRRQRRAPTCRPEKRKQPLAGDGLVTVEKPSSPTAPEHVTDLFERSCRHLIEQELKERKQVGTTEITSPLGREGGGVRHGFPNPDSILDQNIYNTIYNIQYGLLVTPQGDFQN